MLSAASQGHRAMAVRAANNFNCLSQTSVQSEVGGELPASTGHDARCVGGYKALLPVLGKKHSSGAVWESRGPSLAVRPNEPSGFRGRKAILNHASALVSACP